MKLTSDIRHAVLAASLAITPCKLRFTEHHFLLNIKYSRLYTVAMMSRPVAGVRRSTIILTVPGSPKGAKECLAAVIKLLPHACIQAAGGESRPLHAGGVEKLEKEAGVAKASSQTSHHSHHHQHHGHGHGHCHGHIVPKAHTSPSERPQSNDPNAGPTRRYRSSPYPMLEVDEALKLISEHTPDPTVVEVPVDASLVGLAIAEDVYAPEAVPAYRASIVDGYAIMIGPGSSNNAHGSTKGKFPVASVSHAQAASMPPPLISGNIARITTGAPLPENANAVAMVEDTVLVSTTPDGNEEEVVEILTANIKPGENVREPGSDVALGSKILQKGDLVTAVGGEIGLLTSTGVRTVKVYRKPQIGVLSTGDELVEYSDPISLTGGQIRDSNRPSIISCLTSWGFNAVDLGIARDTAGHLEQIIRDALRGGTPENSFGVDIIVTTGGASMGELDLLKPTIERQLGGTIHFGRVAMKPGKPTTFASVPFKPSAPQTTQHGRESRLVFSLPGNPASALVTLNLFVLPSLHKTSGLGQAGGSNLGLPIARVILAHSLRLDPKRTEYHRAVVSAESDGRLLATSTGITGSGQRSSRVGSMARANALLILPPGDGSAKKGDFVRALMMGPLVGIGAV